MKQNCKCVLNWNSTVILNKCDNCNITSTFKNMIFKVSSETEISNLVSEVFELSKSKPGFYKIKAIGGGLSYNQIAKVDEEAEVSYMLNFSDFNKILSVDKENNIVKVQAGIILEDLLKQLEGVYNLTLMSFPVLLKQTIAGSIATASHGHGMEKPCISDLIRSIKYVDGYGKIKEINHGEENFGAFIANLGVLGIITEVEIQCVPSILYVNKEFNLSCEEYLNQFDELHKNNKYIKSWYFPPLNKIHVYTQNPLKDEICEKFELNNQIEIEKSCHSECVRDPVQNINSSSKNEISEVLSKTEIHFEKFYGESTKYGTFYELACLKTNPPFQINGESCIPSDKAKIAVEKLFDYVNKNKNKMTFHGPVDIRFVSRSDGWLSPYQSGSLCFGILRYETFLNSREYHKDGFKFINDMALIFKELESRPHWGKLFDSSIYNFKKLYPKWRDFQRIRKENDPNDLFNNGFTKKIFANIEYRSLKDLRISVLALGGSGIGNIHGNISDEVAIQTVRESISQGINFIDTSPFYGESERRLGIALSNGLREKIILCTKVGTSPIYKGYDKKSVLKSLEESRKLLKTDYIDIVLIHDPTKPEDIEECFSENGALNTLIEYKEQGHCKYIGIGVREHDTLIRFMESGKIDVILTYLDYNIWNRSASERVFPVAKKYNVAVLNGSPLGMGKIKDDKSLLPKAIQFAINHEVISSCLIGCKNANELIEDIEAYIE